MRRSARGGGVWGWVTVGRSWEIKRGSTLNRALFQTPAEPSVTSALILFGCYRKLKVRCYLTVWGVCVKIFWV